jgi:hypothetical protein
VVTTSTPSGSDGFSSAELGLDPADDVERVLALAHHDDAADHVALAVEIGDTAPHLRPERHLGDVLDLDRRATGGGQHELLDVLDALDVAAAAHHVLAPAARPGGRRRRCCRCAPRR